MAELLFLPAEFESHIVRTFASLAIWFNLFQQPRDDQGIG